MVVTVMRDTELKVEQNLPKANQIEKLKKDIDAGTYLGDVTDARAKLKEVQLLFPLKLSEAEPKKN